MASPICSALFLLVAGISLALQAFGMPSDLHSRSAEIAGPPVSAKMFKAALNTSPYVFTVFTQDSESNMFVYTSEDALNFSLLKGPAYVPPTGIIRDPSIIMHTE